MTRQSIPTTATHFVVNTSRKESDLQKLTDNEIADFAKSHRVSVVHSGAEYKQLDRARRYACEREVFERPIGKNQGVAFPIADSYIEIEAANLMRFRAAALFDAAQPCGAQANMAKLLAAKATIRAFDPEGHKEAAKHMQLTYCADTYDALEGADGVVILTEWNEFRALDFARVRAALKTPLMVDLRNIYRPAQMTENGFRYISVGRA